jgi:hypothetical protein
MMTQTAIAWADVERRLEAARNFWIVSAGPAGPHAAPVWGVWLDGALYFSTGRRTVKGRNLAADPRVSVHLESADDVVMFTGAVRDVAGAEEIRRAAIPYAAKYTDSETGQPMDLAAALDSLDGVLYAVRPRTAWAWREADFLESQSRWQFPIVD